VNTCRVSHVQFAERLHHFVVNSHENQLSCITYTVATMNCDGCRP
jgi:hypothetical protein